VAARANGTTPGYDGDGFKKLANFLLSARLRMMGGAVAIAIGSEYVLRVQQNGRLPHFMNPSNFGIAVVLVAFHWTGILPWAYTVDRLARYGRVLNQSVARAQQNKGAQPVNSFTSLSLDPPSLLFCPAKSTKTGQMIHRAKGFSVNILRKEQQPLSVFFAGSWKQSSPPAHRFVPLEGVPRLEGSLGSLACSMHQIL